MFFPCRGAFSADSDIINKAKPEQIRNIIGFLPVIVKLKKGTLFYESRWYFYNIDYIVNMRIRRNGTDRGYI